MFAARLANPKTASSPTQAHRGARRDQAKSAGGMRNRQTAADQAAEPAQAEQADLGFADQASDFGKISVFSSRECDGMALKGGTGSAEPMALSSGARFEGRLQAKLEVGPVDDPLEREADQMANRVMRAHGAGDENGRGPVQARIAAGVARMQRKCAACEHEDEEQGKLQRKCSACEQEEEQHKISRKAVSGGEVTQAAEVSPAVGEVLRSPGRPLEGSVRGFFEERFGYDFAQVRVHTDAKAAASARSVGALAYTVGPHIVFGRSHFDTDTTGGRHLLAHELAHTVQQGSARNLAGGKMEANSTGERVQRQPEAGVHSSDSSFGPPGVSFEKWSTNVEAMYRRNGLLEAANAVKRCRAGDCAKVLTEEEAYAAYRAGRVKAGLGEAPEKQATGGGVGAAASVPAMAGVAAPAAAGAGAPATAPAAESAAARAAARWAPQAARVAEAEAAAARAAAARATAAAAEVAIPVALGIYVTVAIVDLVGYTSFQTALRQQGYVILPHPLAVCISGCHYSPPPKDPLSDPWGSGRLGGPSEIPQIPGHLDEKDKETLEKWIEAQQGTPAPVPTPATPQAPQPLEGSRRRPARTAPTPAPVAPPVPATPPRPRSKKCTEQEQKDLDDEVQKQCKNRGAFACLPTDSYTTAVEKISKLNGCISARVIFQQKCWQKGDPLYEGHMQQIADLYKILRDCEEIAKKKMPKMP